MGEGDLPDNDASVGAGSDEPLAPMDGGSLVIGEPTNLRDRLAMTRVFSFGLSCNSSEG